MPIVTNNFLARVWVVNGMVYTEDMLGVIRRVATEDVVNEAEYVINNFDWSE